MDTHEILKQAIESRTPVEFNYASSDGAVGRRVGSPHALYAHPTTRNIRCDIYQHGGDSSSGNVQPFKPFVLAKISDIELLDGEPFQRHNLYDPDAPTYVNTIAKV
jgi:predicted DNA-binding transcriptional regulator YafY